MNIQDEKYRSVGLCRDMVETAEIVARFDVDRMRDSAGAIRSVGRLLMTGEGSSRIFPAKHVMKVAMQRGAGFHLATESSKQAGEYPLGDWAVFGASNSGRTAELIQTFLKLREAGNSHLYSLTAHANSKLEEVATHGYVLQCGNENAVAATKSVVEQALFYQALAEHLSGEVSLGDRLADLGQKMLTAMTVEIDSKLIEKIAQARMVCFAGRNDGVAEELTLKTNEITRKQADFFEGTYAAHGVEEVLDATDVVLWIDPFEDQEAKFEEVLVEGVGLTVIAISARKTRFPTIRIPDAGDLSGYVQMAAGWNVLVETGLRLGVNLDKPQRARKVGNEFVE